MDWDGENKRTGRRKKGLCVWGRESCPVIYFHTLADGNVLKEMSIRARFAEKKKKKIYVITFSLLS